MKLLVDTHSHTLVSGHAYSTINEMILGAKEKGLEALAITEHAPKMPGTCHQFYFSNYKVLPREKYGVHVLFGTELNILDSEGTVDLPENLLAKMDICIASIHMPCYGLSKGMEENTKAYVYAMKNPYVNIIGHPDDGRYPVDMEVLARTAKEEGVLLEINNSSLRPDGFRENTVENAREMLKWCKHYGTMVTVGSDAHIDLDAGNFEEAYKLFESIDFPEELVATTSFEKLKQYTNLYKNR